MQSNEHIKNQEAIPEHTHSGSPYQAANTETGAKEVPKDGKSQGFAQPETQSDAGIKTQSGKSWQDTAKSDIDSASKDQAGVSDENNI